MDIPILNIKTHLNAINVKYIFLYITCITTTFKFSYLKHLPNPLAVKRQHPTARNRKLHLGASR